MANTNFVNKKRLQWMYRIGLVLIGILIVKLFWVMVIDAPELQAKAESQWTRELAVTAQRGDILDANGEVLARSATSQSVLLRPNDIDDPGEVAGILAPILEMDEQEIYDLASDKSRIEVWLKRHITTEQATAIEQANLDGVDFFSDTQRYYMYGEFASQVLGYTNADGEGQDGLEKEFEKYLAGYDGMMLAYVDANSRTIEGSEQMYIEPQDGLNVVTTLDARIQSFAETAAREAMEQNDAQGMVAIVMDPQDASILAMVNYPELDLNNIDRSDSEALAELSRNRAITDAYEPGSTFKILTTAAALDSGAATLDTHYTCTGAKLVDGEKISCWRTGNPHGDQDLTTAVENSCNPAFMEMALAMGTETFYEYMRNFGLGQPTGINFSTDGSGILMNEKYVRNTDLARIGFGQSVAVTPLQLATAVSAVINGGELYEPRLVSSLQDSEGNTVIEYEPELVRQVISEDTSAKMRSILESVVANGSGKNCQIEGYRVGGKTGTAQLYDEDGQIVEGKHISSFIGFAPADDPQYLCLFIVYEPNVAVDYGSVVAAPFAKDILEKCLKMAGIPAQDTGDSETVSVPNLIGMTEEQAQTAAEEVGLSINMTGSGKVAYQSPSEGAEVQKGSIIEVVGENTTAPDNTVPNVVGKTFFDAYETLREAGLQMELQGTDSGDGTVATQEPAAGTEITPDLEKIVVTANGAGSKEDNAS